MLFLSFSLKIPKYPNSLGDWGDRRSLTEGLHTVYVRTYVTPPYESSMLQVMLRCILRIRSAFQVFYMWTRRRPMMQPIVLYPHCHDPNLNPFPFPPSRYHNHMRTHTRTHTRTIRCANTTTTNERFRHLPLLRIT